METQAFVYKWTHIPTLKWYVGSRTAIGCHPNDGYICSSKIVKPMIELNPNEWRREIIALGEIKEMRKLEADILKLVDAAKDLRSFNKSNSDGKFIGSKQTLEHREKNRLIKLGKKRGPFSEEHKKKISNSNKGKKHKPQSDETKKKISDALKGRPGHPQSDETKRKLREFNLGKKLGPMSEEHKKKISNSNKGKIQIPHSEEYKKKLSEIMKNVWKNKKLQYISEPTIII